MFWFLFRFCLTVVHEFAGCLNADPLQSFNLFHMKLTLKNLWIVLIFSSPLSVISASLNCVWHLSFPSYSRTKSILSNQTPDLCLQCTQSASSIIFTQRNTLSFDNWCSTGDQQARCPTLSFIPLLTGHRDISKSSRFSICVNQAAAKLATHILKHRHQPA